MAEIIDEDNLLGNEGLYVELSPDGKIKRHLNANGKEIPLSDTTIAEELIQLCSLSENRSGQKTIYH